MQTNHLCGHHPIESCLHTERVESAYTSNGEAARTKNDNTATVVRRLTAAPWRFERCGVSWSQVGKPVLLTVDDDPEVLRAIERDLRQRYGERYRILRADSGKAALEALTELRKRNEPVALLLVDQRMPQMSGVAFLLDAVKLYPESKRAMLTAYADTDAAIRAINEAD